MPNERDPRDPMSALVGAADSVETLRAQIRHLVSFDAVKNPHVPTVLLLGETGTGKGLVARMMHESGPRTRGPFIDVNCAAIPDAMLESELFGFEAGAFTDARRPKPGLFEAASGGTLFLDEINALTGPLQSKLLKAIEEKQVRRLGAVAAHHVDVKLIAATQSDLPALVERGAFRADLYHRLAVVILTVPPLRERGQDMLVLAEHFLTTYGRAHGLAPRRLCDDAAAWLVAQPWPGNVRELGHLMERVTLLAPETDVRAEHLVALAAPTVASPIVASTPIPAPHRESASARTDAEAVRIRDALVCSGGNVVAAARLLGIGRNALRYRMRRHGIPRPPLEPTGPAPTAAVPIAPPPTGTVPVGVGGAGRERKQIAVLAIELTFPEGGDDERAPYEPWTIVNRWQSALTDAVSGFGGAFLPHGPSRSTAVFGVPRALEQIPLRAIRAALAVRRLQSTILRDTTPELRLALHLGTVELDGASDDPLGRMRPVGDTLALADRLLGHASAGEILVSTVLARRVRAICDLEPREVRIGTTSLAVFAVATTHLQQLPAREEEAGFVGRDAELDLLAGAFASAATGRGQVAFVMGDAGLGKSRLLAEFRARVADTDHVWVEGHCESYGASTALLPMADALRRFFGIDEGDDGSRAAAKVATGLAAFGDELAWTRPFLEGVLSLHRGQQPTALDAASWRSETFRALKALLLRMAEMRPLVLLIEDLHWVDPASEDLIVFLAEGVPTARILLICSHRPGYRKPLADRTYHLQLALRPLSVGEVATMTGTLLRGEQLPETWRALIARKAEGNPFFVEEVTRSLLEDGSLDHRTRDIAELVVPDTIQDVLLARLDRLPDAARRAIQVASVIGREFVLRLLARIVQAGDELRGLVDELRTLELVYEKATHPELAYMFKHALTHDVAYESIVPERRRALHQMIGEAIEELYRDRLPEHYETLAYHFTESEAWQRAFDYHERAAEKAAGVHANHAVVTHCRAAFDVATHLEDAETPEVCRRLRYLAERHGLAALQTSEFADSGDAFDRAAALAMTPNGQAVACANAAIGYFWAHDYERCERAIARSLAIARAADLPGPQAMALATHGWYRAVHDADMEEYERACDAAAVLSASIDNAAVDAMVRYQRVMFAEWVGDYATVVALADGVVADARRLGLPHLVVLPSWFLGKALCCLGRYGESLVRLEEAYAFCDRIGDRAWRGRLLNTLGWCYAEIGDHVAAHRFNERAVVIARAFGDPEIIANSEINLAACAIALGDPDAGRRHLEPIAAELARPGDPWMRWRYSLHVDDLLARLELEGGELDQALARVQRTVDGARRYRAPKIEARALVLQGDVLLRADQRDDAAASVRAALAVATRIGYARAGWQAHALLAETARRAGQETVAAEHEAERRARIERMGANLDDGALRARLFETALGPQ